MEPYDVIVNQPVVIDNGSGVIKAGFAGVMEEIKQFALWNNKLKTVEGMYGSGVYNFFKFFKWSMGEAFMYNLKLES